MSLFSWFARKSAPPKTTRPAPPQPVLGADATVPLAPGRSVPPPDPAANRKNERIERRELLYLVVRDAMVRASVLSSSYKFKVLSLDQQGRQFLIMIDLAREYGGDTSRLSEIEALVAQTAKARFDILVTAVYWRINEHVAVGQPPRSAGAGTSPTPHLMARAARAPRPPAAPLVPPAPPPELALPVLGAQASAAVPLEPAPLLAPRGSGGGGGGRFDPIEADEVAAFKRALSASAASTPAVAPAPGVPVHSGPRRPLAPPAPSTGFEDTELPDEPRHDPDLGRTQYGELN